MIQHNLLPRPSFADICKKGGWFGIGVFSAVVERGFPGDGDRLARMSVIEGIVMLQPKNHDLKARLEGFLRERSSERSRVRKTCRNDCSHDDVPLRVNLDKLVKRRLTTGQVAQFETAPQTVGTTVCIYNEADQLLNTSRSQKVSGRSCKVGELGESLPQEEKIKDPDGYDEKLKT
ncbi:hypothetical protein EDB19DRAFT_1838823 [Suillus lakei]|nr:hypothetical protein EDB19DRAFT_1838823 [Suillus lakei]